MVDSLKWPVTVVLLELQAGPGDAAVQGPTGLTITSIRTIRCPCVCDFRRVRRDFSRFMRASATACSWGMNVVC